MGAEELLSSLPLIVDRRLPLYGPNNKCLISMMSLMIGPIMAQMKLDPLYLIAGREELKRVVSNNATIE